MVARGSHGTSSLLTPLHVVDVLIPDEVVQYNERKHWASLIQPFLETIAVLIFITMFAGGLPNGALGGFLFLIALAVLIVMYRQNKWKKPVLYLSAFGLLAGFLLMGIEAFAIVLILGAAARFIYRAAMWAFYERLYITNRRVIASSGFLGAQINGMPLTRITDIAFRRTVLGEILNYGTFRLETAGQDQALGLIPFLNQPDLFYNILIHHSTTALGSVKDPLSKEKIAEARAITIKPRTQRPGRMPSILRRRGGATTTTATATETIADDFTDSFTEDITEDFEDGT